jgi:hypothetical protein
MDIVAFVSSVSTSIKLPNPMMVCGIPKLEVAIRSKSNYVKDYDLQLLTPDEFFVWIFKLYYR